MTYAISNQKGGVGKTSLTLNLGAALARSGKRVLIIDCDPQANATMALGFPQPDELPVTLADIIAELIQVGSPEKSELVQSRECIRSAHGMDFVPSSIALTGVENILVNTMSRESVLKKFIGFVKGCYDAVLLDCMPSLNIITVNALNAADKVIIPTQPQYFSAKGLELLLSTIGSVRENLNPNLEIEGVVVNMYDGRLNFNREVVSSITAAYGEALRVFETKIPVSVRMTETQASGQSMFEREPNGKLAQAYISLAKEMGYYE
jgi:chromosome partitioning protein